MWPHSKTASAPELISRMVLSTTSHNPLTGQRYLHRKLFSHRRGERAVSSQGVIVTGPLLMALRVAETALST